MPLFNFFKKRRTPRDVQVETREQRILREVGEKKRRLEAEEKAKRRGILSREFGEAKFKVGRGIGEFAGIGMQRRPDFSREQLALKEMFGGGEKIWGVPDSETGVTIHHDLNPRQRGDTSTAELFGFG